MKKILTLVSIAFIGLTAKAQDTNQGLKGTWFVTSQFGYQQTKTGDSKNTTLSVLPIVGTFVTPSVAVGAAVGYINVKADSDKGTVAKTDLIVAQPLVRKYWNIDICKLMLIISNKYFIRSQYIFTYLNFSCCKNVI